MRGLRTAFLDKRVSTYERRTRYFRCGNDLGQCAGIRIAKFE